MSELKRGLQKVIKGAIDNAVRKETEEWPPRCSTTIFYQPKRPPLPNQEKQQQTK